MNEIIKNAIIRAKTDIALGFYKQAIGRLEWILANEKVLENEQVHTNCKIIFGSGRKTTGKHDIIIRR